MFDRRISTLQGVSRSIQPKKWLCGKTQMPERTTTMHWWGWWWGARRHSNALLTSAHAASTRQKVACVRLCDTDDDSHLLLDWGNNCLKPTLNKSNCIITLLSSLEAAVTLQRRQQLQLQWPQCKTKKWLQTMLITSMQWCSGIQSNAMCPIAAGKHRPYRTSQPEGHAA